MTTNGNQNPLEALQTDASFARDVAQVRAKAILTELTGGAPPYRWSYTPTRLSRHSSAALWDLGSVSLSNLDRISEFEPVARQIAQAWEAFAKLGEGATRHTALLNAAAAYEYAGYQANAACLSKLVIGEGPSETETDFQQLCSALYAASVHSRDLACGFLVARAAHGKVIGRLHVVGSIACSRCFGVGTRRSIFFVWLH